VLILLPPSEGKTAPSSRRAPADLAALPFDAELGPLRRRLVAAIDPALVGAPAAPAAEVYTGVLYGLLDVATLPPAARARARRSVLIASGLWGLVGPGDRIPAYKLPIDAKVPAAGGTLASAWRPLVAAALAPRDTPRELVVDCRSGGYAAVWRPSRATRVEVRAFRVHPDGRRQVVTHMAKASRGLVARALLLAPRAARRPADVAAAAAAAGLEAELTQGRGGWTLDVLQAA
jgi:cytoplasmic iron level regulating protein YaaA (DUF328/UPF0246 family)